LRQFFTAFGGQIKTQLGEEIPRAWFERPLCEAGQRFDRRGNPVAKWLQIYTRRGFRLSYAAFKLLNLALKVSAFALKLLLALSKLATFVFF
jgi:hypothetical protein